MKKVDWMIAENHRILDEMHHRTKVENEAFMLVAKKEIGRSERTCGNTGRFFV